MTHTELQQAKAGISIRVREVRISRGLTQEQLAALAAINQSVITKIEQGKSCYPRVVEGLAIALQVNPVWIQWGGPFATMQLE